jgi:DNA polymerase alpha subunit A
MARIQFFNIPHWSRIGRLKKSQFPTRKLDQGGYSGSSWIPRMVSCGRLLVDTFVSSKELLRETNYDLGYLAQKQLKTTRKDFDDDMLAEFFLNSDRLLSLVSHTETDTFLTLKLMLHLNILPLTKQLTNIAGNLWFRSLQNARAERNEMFLMHEFRGKKYLCPDKKSFSAKEAKKMEFGDEDAAEVKTVKGKRQKAKYGGGLVLEPKAGFYDNIIMMLDFNSLYPSII